jgi:SAM-dependent methyltransferase
MSVVYAIVQYTTIVVMRKLIRLVSPRTETWYVHTQYEALNTILTHYKHPGIGFDTTMNMGFHHTDYNSAAFDPLFCGTHPTTRLQLQLYHRVVTGGPDLAGLDVLEVGCGRGGGAVFVSNTFKPRSMTGLDFSVQGVAQCHTTWPSSSVQFHVGDAQELPYRTAQFDVVLNVESSHCYPQIGRFLQEAYRVLKPGGYLLYCDISTPTAAIQLRAHLTTLGWTLVETEELTPGVVCALEQAADLRHPLPWPLRYILPNVLGHTGSLTSTNFRTGIWIYHRLVCQKPLRTPL